MNAVHEILLKFNLCFVINKHSIYAAIRDYF